MDPIKIIKKYYDVESRLYELLVEHSKAVTNKSLEVARGVPEYKPDLEFIKEAAMLHDIGIFLTDTSDLLCFGDKPYICHGYLGREIVEREGFPKHALVCERHISVGISLEEIEKQKLPIPKRDMWPVSIEEEIICYADKYFSKNEEFLEKEKSVEKIKKGLLRFGEDKIKIFEGWMEKFG